MKKYLKEVLKRIYQFSLRFKFVRKWRKKYKRHRMLKKKQQNKAWIENNLKPYYGLSAAECNIKEVTMPKESSRYQFGFDVLGLIKGIKYYDAEEYFTKLNDILENEDINCRLAITTKEERDDNSDAFEFMEKKLKLFTLVPGEAMIVSDGDTKVMMFAFDVSREGDEEKGRPEVEAFVAKQIAYAKEHHVNYVVGYAMREPDSSVTSTPFERKYLRAVCTLGVHYVFGANEFGIHNGGNIKRYNDTFARAMISTGCLFGAENALEKEGRDAAVAIRVKILLTEEQGIITNAGYIPLYNIKKETPYDDVIRMDYRNSEHRKNSGIMDALEYVEKESGTLRDIKNILTLKDICDLLEVEVPEKYKYLENVSVGKVCSRSFEVDSGDVLFFRQPFQDPNDGEPVPLPVRLRIVDKAIARGARFVFSFTPLDEDIPHIVIEDAREAHIKVCARLRKMYAVRTVGITGSIGKTSTKDMLYNVLSEKYDTHRNLRNTNTQVNIGLHVQELRAKYEVFIQEIGGGRPGGASRHSRMILPEATVVTNIGLAHIGNYGTQEKLMESKLGIIDGMNEDGVIYLNGDDPLLVTAKVDAKTVFYAIHNHEADYYADNIVESGGKTTFEIVHGEQRVPAELNVLGEYNVLNAVCCYAIGKQFKLSDEEIVRGIAKFETSGVRQNLISVGGYNLFVDCFNATPASIESALSVLDAIETDHRKIAVLGDVTGMAELSHDVHVSIGNIVKEHHMDEVVCYGEESKVVNKMAQEAGIKSCSITNPKELKNYLETKVELGDVVLFKGSSKNLLAQRIDEVYGTMLSDQAFIDKVKYKEEKKDGITYNVYPEYATVIGNYRVSGPKVIQRAIKGVPVYSIADGAFADLDACTAVTIPEGIRHIGAGSFVNCGSLESIVMPSTIKYIDESAFSNCKSLKEVKLNKGIMHIAKNAFEKCSSLEELFIPETVTEIGEDVFARCDNLTVSVKRGSYAEKYCKSEGVEYKIV